MVDLTRKALARLGVAENKIMVYHQRGGRLLFLRPLKQCGPPDGLAHGSCSVISAVSTLAGRQPVARSLGRHRIRMAGRRL